MANAKRRMKVDITECKSIGEWLKRCGPYDRDQIALDLVTGVPLALHEAVYMILRAYTAWRKDLPMGGIVPGIDGLSYPRGPQFLCHEIRALTRQTVPKVIGERLFQEFNAGSDRKRKRNPYVRKTDWDKQIVASSYWGESKKTLQEMKKTNGTLIVQALDHMQVYPRLRYEIDASRHDGHGIKYKVETRSAGRVYVTFTFPQAIEAKMATREPVWFAQCVATPDRMSQSGHKIKAAKRAIILQREVIGYIGVATPRNAIAEVTWLMDGGAGAEPQEVSGLQFSRHLLAAHRDELDLAAPYGVVDEYESSRFDRLFKNYYVTSNKRLMLALRNMLKRRS